jgi:hypothetical protein
VADALRREPGVQVQLEDGDKGEFTVLVDGRPFFRKGDAMPSVEEVVAVVRRAQPAATAGA